MVNRICTTCKKEFSAKMSEIKRGGGKFCSPKCFYKKNSGTNHCFYGKKHSLNTKKRMSISKKGKYVGKNNPFWKGGPIRGGYGYMFIYKPNHPFCNKRNYVFEHRLVVENHLGRYLTKKEIVHHIDGNRSNNVIPNLYFFESHSKHMSYHLLLKNNPELRITKSNLTDQS